MTKMQNQLPDIQLGRYRHYKGKEYEVVGVGTHTETREVLVVYKCLYDTPGYERDALWMRPYDMFTEMVVVDGNRVPRFEYMSPCHSERSRGISAKHKEDLSTSVEMTKELMEKIMSDKPRVGVGFGVMILNEKKEILLGHRHLDPEKADSELHGEGTWTMPGGKIEFGETFEQAATREVAEETSLKIECGDLKLISLENDAVSDAQFVTIGFLCTKFTSEVKVMEPDEITEWRWFSLDSLPSPIFFPSQKIIDHYHSGRIYK